MANDRKAPRGGGVEPSYRPDETPLSSSAVVIRRSNSSSSPPSRRRRSVDESAYDLTPYQARLDVAMDDTAVSKVRDPSVSLRLGADGSLPEPARRASGPSLDAFTSVALGTVIGALLVVASVLLFRLLQH